MTFECIYSSPVGELRVVTTDTEVLMCDWIASEKHAGALKRIGGDFATKSYEGCDFMRKVVTELDEYFNGSRCVFDLSLRLVGTPFQLDVWKALQSLEYGRTVSYATLANKSGHASSIRAVASAVAMNPISVFLPCHRVIRSDGTIGNYRGGDDAKKFLLELERKCDIQ